MLDANGTPIQSDQREVPAIVVGWDGVAQDAILKFNPESFKTWDMVIAVLQIGIRKAEHNMRMQQSAQMQQALIEQQQAAALGQQLRGRKHSG